LQARVDELEAEGAEKQAALDAANKRIAEFMAKEETGCLKGLE